MTDIAFQPAAERYMASFKYEMEHYSPYEFYIASVLIDKAVSAFPVFVLDFLFVEWMSHVLKYKSLLWCVSLRKISNKRLVMTHIIIYDLQI